jgi:parallel beta-helix repeat protein
MEAILMIPKYASKLMVLGAMFLAAQQGLWAATYYVGPKGSDSNSGLTKETPLLTLQAAGNLTRPGDVVYALSGTYTAPNYDPAVLDIATPGTANAWIRFAAYPGQHPKISFNGWAGVKFEPTTAYIVIEGFEIVGNNANVTLAGALQQPQYGDAAYNGNCVVAQGTVAGSSVAGSHHLQILNNKIGECGGGGIALINTDYVTLSGNTVYNSAWYGVYASSGISILTPYNSDGYTGYKNFVVRNRVFGNRNYLLATGLGYTALTDGEGIIMDTFNGNSYAGRTLVANNIAYNNGSAGIEVFDGTNVDVANNSTYGNIKTPELQGVRGEIFLNQVGTVNAVNNVLESTNTLNPLYVAGSCNCTLDSNVYFGGDNVSTLVDNNAIYGNPLYDKPDASDGFNTILSVANGSPTIDTGTIWLAPDIDFYGTARYVGHWYDRGAFDR